MSKMNLKVLLNILVLLLTSSCQSQSLLPFSDLDEIKKHKSVLSYYTCEDLIEKAQDKDFSLKNLAGLRAQARCKEYKFNFSDLSDLEKKLYSAEIESFNTPTTETKAPQDYSIKELKKLVKKEKDAKLKLSYYKQLRAKLKKSTDRTDYLQTSTQLYKWALQNYKKKKKKIENLNIYYESTQIYARTFWTDDDGETALKSLNEAIKLIPEIYSRAELFYLKGRIHEEAKDSSEAIANYDLTLTDLAQFNPKNLSFTLERVLWLKAWILYKNRQHEDSAKAFQALNEATTDLSEKSRAQFYLARSLKNTGKEIEAKALLDNVAQNDFFGYYGLVAYRELGKKLPALAKVKTASQFKFDIKLEFLAETERQIYTDLIKFREYHLAERALNLIAKSKEQDINLSLYLAKKAQMYLPLFRSFARLNNDEKLDVFINYPELIFPQPYKDQVEEMASKTNLPASLIYSIMKQESAFNEKARSHADAMGLMQVIPRLAKQLSRKFEVPFKKEDDLYDPNINIQLGSYELMEQVKKQNGQLTYVAAAYNAGPNALSNWLKNRNRDDILEFIEEIPYDETRTYVKLIARNKLFYERISNRHNEHDFPPDFLN